MKLLTTVFFLSLILVANSQKYELGKVTINELSQKKHPKEFSAEAAILFSKGTTYFEYSQNEGFSMITDVEKKIKIYSIDGYKFADFSVPLYNSNDGREIANFSNAITYNLVNGVIEKTKLKNENKFDEKVDKNWSKSKISMPNVKEGSIIEYKYSIRSPFFINLTKWDFQQAIPVDYSEYKIGRPEYFSYNPHLKGYLTPKITSDIENKTINFIGRNTDNRNSLDRQLTNGNIEYKEFVTNYTIKDVPSLKEEDFVNNIDNYRSSIEHELSGIQFPNQFFKSYASTWESVVKKIFENDKFGSELSKTNFFENEIAALVKDLKTDNEKINTVYQYVQNRMSWNEYKRYTCEIGVEEAFKTKTGNSAEINLMLTSMLRYAGIKAYPIILSTRDNGINIFPSLTAFNYVIAGIEIDDDITMLDATNKNSLPNILPLRDLNWSGRLIKKDGTSLEIDLMPNILSKKSNFISCNLDPNGTISGTQNNQYFDYYAYDYRNRFNATSKDKYLEDLEKRYIGLEIENYEKLPNTDLKVAVQENFTFKTDNCVERIAGKLYVSPLLYLAQTSNPFKEETREYPVDFNFPKIEKININVIIPDSYNVETMPANTSFKMENDLASFVIQYEQFDNEIQVKVAKTINTSVIGAEDYIGLKNYFKKLVEKETEKIVLVKK